MKVVIAAVAFAVLFGCAPEYETYQDVRIVHLGDQDEIGVTDEYTIVEFPDGTRRLRALHWGELGDTFSARKSGSAGWTP